MPIRLATWNVNSIRTRLDHVSDWLAANPVDALCLQETKVVDQDFPSGPFEAMGYHPYVYGQKAYNGVAIVAKAPLSAVDYGFSSVLGPDATGDLDDQKRVISGVCQGIRIVNLYVPNGSSIGSEKYAYKLRWLALLKTYLETLLSADSAQHICGDFNVALDDIDIHDPEGKDRHIMASPQERQALRDLLSLGLADAFRKLTPEGGHYSWWDYRAASFRRNLGWRIDHHYLSPDLYGRVASCTIDIAPRKLEKPSDHAPVILELAEADRSG